MSQPATDNEEIFEVKSLIVKVMGAVAVLPILCSVEAAASGYPPVPPMPHTYQMQPPPPPMPPRFMTPQISAPAPFAAPMMHNPIAFRAPQWVQQPMPRYRSRFSQPPRGSYMAQGRPSHSYGRVNYPPTSYQKAPWPVRPAPQMAQMPPQPMHFFGAPPVSRMAKYPPAQPNRTVSGWNRPAWQRQARAPLAQPRYANPWQRANRYPAPAQQAVYRPLQRSSFQQARFSQPSRNWGMNNPYPRPAGQRYAPWPVSQPRYIAAPQPTWRQPAMTAYRRPLPPRWQQNRASAPSQWRRTAAVHQRKPVVEQVNRYQPTLVAANTNSYAPRSFPTISRWNRNPYSGWGGN